MITLTVEKCRHLCALMLNESHTDVYVSSCRLFLEDMIEFTTEAHQEDFNMFPGNRDYTIVHRYCIEAGYIKE